MFLSTDDLPDNIMVDVLSRLPVKTILHCKCVCRKWRNLVMDSYFASVHLSRSPTCFMIHHHRGDTTSFYDDVRTTKPGSLDWFETTTKIFHLEYEQYWNRARVKRFHLNRAPIFKNSGILPVGSVNGLICLQQFRNEIVDTCICNPITREYMILQREHKFPKVPKPTDVVYGFGVGLQTKEYKVIRIFQGNIPPNSSSASRPLPSEAEVYTLGTGKWRSLCRAPYWLNELHWPFLNGRVHWIVLDQDSPEKICSSDIDNETFQLFPSPPVETIKRYHDPNQSLGVLKGCLFQSDLVYRFEFSIWVMKEYGIKKSWHKDLTIKLSYATREMGWMDSATFVIEGLEDGTILLVNELGVVVYSLVSKTVEKECSLHYGFTGIAYRPSFLKLQDFESETCYVL